MKRKTEKVVIEAEVPKSLTEVGVDAVDAAIKAATPYIEQAREIGSHRVADAQARLAPLAEQARERLAPIADQAKERRDKAQDFLAPYVTDAQAKIGPVAHEAKVRGAAGARTTLDSLAPRLESALLAVGPIADEAAARLHDEVVPRAAKFLDQAAEVEPLSRRQRRKARKTTAKLEKAAAKVTKANAKALARAERSGSGNVWKVLLVLTGIIGVAILVAKKLGTPKEDAWQNYQPTPPAPAAAPADAPTAATAEAPDEEMDDETAESEAEMIGEGGHVTEADAAVSTDTATSYGPDSFVGTNPPAEFTIKGNPRSMKYHLPGSDSYERTITDVWFATEEAAQAAGFTKATR